MRSISLGMWALKRCVRRQAGGIQRAHQVTQWSQLEAECIDGLERRRGDEHPVGSAAPVRRARPGRERDPPPFRTAPGLGRDNAHVRRGVALGRCDNCGGAAGHGRCAAHQVAERRPVADGTVGSSSSRLQFRQRGQIETGSKFRRSEDACERILRVVRANSYGCPSADREWISPSGKKHTSRIAAAWSRCTCRSFSRTARCSGEPARLRTSSGSVCRSYSSSGGFGDAPEDRLRRRSSRRGRTTRARRASWASRTGKPRAGPGRRAGSSCAGRRSGHPSRCAPSRVVRPCGRVRRTDRRAVRSGRGRRKRAPASRREVGCPPDSAASAQDPQS